MEFSYVDIFGLMAAFCTTVSFLPQAYKTITTKDTKGISLWMYVIFTFGVSCWGVYGLLIERYIIVGANVFTLSSSFVILYIKIKNVRKGLDVA